MSQLARKEISTSVSLLRRGAREPARRTEHAQLAALDELDRNLFQKTAHRAGADEALHEKALEQIALDPRQDAAGQEYTAMRAVQERELPGDTAHRSAEDIERLPRHGLAIVERGGSDLRGRAIERALRGHDTQRRVPV